MRDIIILACNECKRRNYTTTRNKRKTPNKLELKNTADFVTPILFIKRQNRTFLKADLTF